MNMLSKDETTNIIFAEYGDLGDTIDALFKDNDVEFLIVDTFELPQRIKVKRDQIRDDYFNVPVNEEKVI